MSNFLLLKDEFSSLSYHQQNQVKGGGGINLSQRQRQALSAWLAEDENNITEFRAWKREIANGRNCPPPWENL